MLENILSINSSMIVVQSPSEINRKVAQKRKCEEVGLCGKKPCYRGTIYEKMLSPLTPSLTLPIQTRVCESSQKLTNKTLQTQLVSILEEADEKALKDFLIRHCAQIDINGYGEDGVTPLQLVCQSGGKVGLARTLVGYGADVRLTSRDDWSAVHMASFSGNTNLMMYLLSCRI